VTKSLASAALLLAALAGCGGGGGANAGNAAANPAAALEDEAGGTAAANKAAAKPAAPPQAHKIDPSLIPPPGVPLARETYSYSGGSRDPFASVLEGASIGPELADLDLVAISYIERTPSASVAVLKDRITGKRYNLREGERAGRARVSDIGPKDVTFTFDDYGTQRQVTLSLRKREDITP
jgi:hypothetical protein